MTWSPSTSLQRMIAEVRGRQFNIAITDIHMPVRGGSEPIRELKSLHGLANALVMACYSNMSNMVDCLASGAIDCFTKPLRRMDPFLDAVAQRRNRIERWQGAIQLGMRDDKSIAV